jgi:hypothetical protein
VYKVIHRFHQMFLGGLGVTLSKIKCSYSEKCVSDGFPKET